MIEPLPLDSPEWSKLRHAYGAATDVPEWLRTATGATERHASDDAWTQLWSALAHQGDVYPASFAAVPHIVAAALRTPEATTPEFLQFPTWVEICRSAKDVVVPGEFSSAYFRAIASLPRLVAATSSADWDRGTLLCAIAALAVGHGEAGIAEVAFELTDVPEREVLTWLHSR